MSAIRYFNRHTGKTEEEAVYGERWLRWAYETAPGRLALHALVKRPLFSKLYGKRMNAPSSRELIAPFVEKFGIEVGEMATPPEDCANFNEFFFRKLTADARPLATEEVIFPCDGRHLGFPCADQVDQVDQVFVKGQQLDLSRLLGSTELAKHFAHGPLVISRLCPVDYHRFHFPAAGTPGDARLINGPLYSVSPIALRRNLSYLWENKRMVTELATESLGTILICEIGATNVGSIHQTFHPGTLVGKGAEKGYFSFGGSCMITLFEPGKVQLAEDLLTYTARGLEHYARFGSALPEPA